MEVRWQVDDGYAGAARPQVTEISAEELAECETEEERQDLINEIVQEDFADRISWYFLK